MQSLRLDPPLFSDTPDSLRQDAEDIRDNFNHVLNAIVQNVEPENATFDNTIAPMAFAHGPLAISGQRTQLVQSASHDEDVRKGARDAHLVVCKIFESWYGRHDLFKRVKTVYEALPTSDMNVEAKKLVETWYRYFRNEGAHLGPDDKKALEEINERINLNRSKFRAALTETKDSLWLTEEELDGLSRSVVDALEQNFDSVDQVQKFRMPLKANTMRVILPQLHNEQVRRRLFEGLERSAVDSLAPFVEVLRARHQKAKLLGNTSWAERCLSQRMARSPEVVGRFLATLREKLTPLAKKELSYLESLKQAQSSTLRCPRATEKDGYYLWDQPYYHQQRLTQMHQLDSHALSEYFPAEATLKGMLKIFEDLFTISIVEVDEASRAALTSDPAALTWHPDVKMFLVWDPSTDATEATFIGYLYVDLYERVGKYSTCANFNVHPGFTAQGHRHPCATALLTNFHPPSPGKPTLLQHSNVVQMFHELGHGMHDLFARTRYAELHGHRVPPDFVEMPSQMLENWCWLPEELASFSMHYSHLSPEYAQAWKTEHGTEQLPPAKLPSEIAEKVAASRGVDLALSSLRQIVYAEFDMLAHGDREYPEQELKQWWHDKREEIGLIPGSAEMANDLGHGFANTIHLIEGSASNYYGYLFSQVYSSDIFHSAFKQSPRNREVGNRYRRTILEPGGSLEPMDMLRKFLGRDPQEDSFLLDIGLGV